MACGYFHVLKYIRPQLGTLCRVTDKQPHFNDKQSYHAVLCTSVNFFREVIWKVLRAPDRESEL